MVFDLIPERLQRSTMKHILRTLRLVIKWQCRNDKTVYNAELAADLEYQRIDPDEDKAREGRALTVDEINKLLDAAYSVASADTNNDLNRVAYWRSTGHAVEVLPQR